MPSHGHQKTYENVADVDEELGRLNKFHIHHHGCEAATTEMGGCAMQVINGNDDQLLYTQHEGGRY